MARPRMIVVAGPPGGGKTRFFPVTAFRLDAFNIDDRCAQILANLPRAVAVFDRVRVYDSTARWVPPRLVAVARGSLVVRHGAAPGWLAAVLSEHGG